MGLKMVLGNIVQCNERTYATGSNYSLFERVKNELGVKTEILGGSSVQIGNIPGLEKDITAFLGIFDDEPDKAGLAILVGISPEDGGYARSVKTIGNIYSMLMQIPEMKDCSTELMEWGYNSDDVTQNRNVNGLWEEKNKSRLNLSYIQPESKDEGHQGIVIGMNIEYGSILNTIKYIFGQIGADFGEEKAVELQVKEAV